MYEEILLYGLREERIAREAVERRLRERQQGLAWTDIEREQNKESKQ